MADSAAVQPGEVPDAIFAEAMHAYAAAYAGSEGQEATVRELNALRAAVAAVLTMTMGALLGLAGSAREMSFEVRGGVMRPVSWTLDPEQVRAVITRELTGKEGGDV